MPVNEVQLNAYAKINLGLRIHEKRGDGYHNIETVFKIISLHDRVAIRLNDRGGARLTCGLAGVPTDESNIMMKAVRSLEKKSDRPIHTDIHLEKHIPMGAGLGGGSSDAAAVLVALSRLLGLSLTGEELMHLGASLGSDVPFFVGFYLGHGATAKGQGRGEVLSYFRWPLTEHVVVVYPNVHVSTPWAYQNFRTAIPSTVDTENERFNLTKRIESAILSAPLEKGLFFDNDFEYLVFREYPWIRTAQGVLVDLGAKVARMSGSGSTLYGLFDTVPEFETLRERLGDAAIFRCRFIDSVK
ncbi:MAG TPA: 4-(cytidine 5'-diphospho)-2-C-methyl-D-erythritol kinase [bacterium]|nr:4-(cytidine 5'-diphospho)-2-C-methyl-D-erythritol kinase [bacterium]HND77915.1 4-(cytidine 5'-diphospho)-2-C-methyl-D-erythritol kinase [bacterium]HNE84106.1 4-(cytidine 5'-diphospho)-2-C-methyl-D-erythritol kinase [bacterium]HNH29652.1 4-(cytidine 5'-diphospho)-2-C-methyl-D-erythritol kinase [bacterium]HNH32424.1 4-(cytidine 5'-diphospho)-2-C-methyl-D-erythritol kinase [bacterium]